MFSSGFGQQNGTGSSPFSFGAQQQQPVQATNSIFGQPAAQPAAPTSFGAPSTLSPFGSTLGATSQPQIGQVQDQGTSLAPFTPHEESDAAKTGKTERYETITVMPQYSNYSIEELRFQDYRANRKGPVAQSGFGFGQTQPNVSSGGAFGQPAQNSPFGGSTFGGAAGNNTNTTGGLFNQGSNPVGGGTGLFGANNQTTGAFGNTANSGSSIFGQPAAQQANAFGGNNSSFGNTSTPSGGGFPSFGGANNTTGLGSSAFGQPAANNSSSSSLFNSKPPGQGPFGTQPNSNSSGFAFGGTQPQSNTGLFGGSNSGTNMNTGSSIFGQNNAGSGNAFGQNKAPSLFGSQANNTGTSIFGNNNTATNNNNSNTTGTSLFGQNNSGAGGFGSFNQNKSTTGSSLFGQPANNNNTTSGGIFGQNNSQPGSNSIFGQNNATSTNAFGQPPQQQSGFGFMNNQNKPAGSLFGQGAASSGAFGQPSGTGTTPAFGATPGTSAFGQANQQQQQQPGQAGGFAFGNVKPAQTGAGVGGGTGLFGQANQQQQKPSFGFNNTASSTPNGGLFGSSAPKPAGSAPAGGLFAQTNNNSGAFGSGGGLFGSANNNNNNNGALGSSTNNTSGGLFGGGSLFSGNNNNNGTGAGSSGSMFGKPLGGGPGGLSGNSNTAQNNGGGLFGNTSSSSNPSTSGFSLGQQGQGSSLFGNNKPATGGLSGGFGTGGATGVNFGATAQPGAGQQQSAAPMASIDSDAYLSHPLFSNVQQTSNSTAQSNEPYAAAKKDTAAFKPPTGILIAQIMQPSSLPRGHRITVGSVANLDDNKKTGESKATTLELKFTQRQPVDHDRFRNALFSNTTDDIILNTEAFDFARSGVKGIALASERDENPQAVSVSTPNRRSPDREVLSENDQFVIVSPSSSRLDEDENGQTRRNDPNGVLTKTKELDSSNDDGDVHGTLGVNQPMEPDTPDNEVVDVNGYWISPAKHKLANMTLREIRQVKDFRVGQRTQGFVEFLEPVDLSMFSDVQLQVCGHVVIFGDRSFCLYPNESERPPVGQGFNKKHRVTLYNIFARRKDTREPIKDPEHPLARKFLKRLQSQSKFVSWSAQTGTWTFEVDPATK